LDHVDGVARLGNADFILLASQLTQILQPALKYIEWMQHVNSDWPPISSARVPQIVMIWVISAGVRATSRSSRSFTQDSRQAP